MEALRERFGKYFVLEKLAQGGMAEVYKVKTIGIAGFEKVQALKRILPSSAREGRFIRSFIDEARIAVELTHRNIVQVFDFGKADGELFLAMELIEGKDLRTAMSQAVARDALPPIAVSAYIVSEVAQGLDYAHRRTDGYGGSLGIVHCDVSPSNVMLSLDGYVKILDFGIARASFSSALERRRLRGKPRYMAPEQTLGETPTSAADVFALGIIAWEMFTGLPLYRGPDLKSILEAVRHTDPPPIERLNPHVPVEICKAIAMALTREPTRRGTAADLAAACARTALAAGASQLSLWLSDFEKRPATRPEGPAREVPQVVETTSVSVPPPAAMPPIRPSRTASLLGNVPAPIADFGEGTPHSIDQPIEPPTAPQRGKHPRPRTDPPEVHPRYETTVPSEKHSYGDFARYPTERTSASAGDARWVHEHTLSGVAKLVDAVPHEGSPITTEPFQRPSYETIARPSVPRFDDRSASAARSMELRVELDAPVDNDVTQHGFVAPPVGPDDTSYDDLELEPDATSAMEPPARVEEPIDDDLGALASGLPAERRRSVVVAGVLTGADRDTLRPVTRMLGELAYQRGGVVLALDDDALVIAFGLEVAGEDDVAVAMGWALDANAMARDATADHVIAFRAGARAGVGTTGGQVPQEALDEAKLLAREAAPERPLFVGGTGRMTSSLYSLREIAAPKRVARRSRVIEVVGPRGFDERDRARLERRGKFVGRAVPLTELEVWFQRAIAANRRFAVLLQGAAGTGKSRLVAELVARRQAAGTPMRLVTTAASPASRLAPFALVIDLYQAALGLAPVRGRVARRQVVDRLLHLMGRAGVSTPRARAVAMDLEHAMELRDGLGVGAPEVADLRPRLSAGLAAFRLAMADRARPLLTVIEDIHLADSASIEVLRHTLAAPAHGPELLVMTARPEAATAALSKIDATIMIGDLVGGELRALIADRLGEAATPVNIAAVLGRGGGNPLFIEELAQAVRDATAGGEDVPASARDVIMARMERLSTAARGALRFASVLGNSLRVRLLEELAVDERASSPARRDSLDEPLLREAGIDELVSAGFLVRDGDNLTFARGLMREVVYESLSARAQRESHARVGRLLASRFFAGREEPPATIAEHLERGGELAGAAAFWLRAGRLALTASDADAAISCFSRTLVLDRELGATPPTATSRVRRREALAGREEAHRLQGDLASDATDLDELQRLCEGEPARLGDVAIRRAQRMMRLGDFAHATVATIVAEDHATAVGDDRLRGEALRVRGEVYERLGRFEEALALVGAARDIFHKRRLVYDEMAAMIGRGRIHLLRAHYEAARDAYRPVLQLIDKTGDPWLERIATNHVAVIEMCLGDFTQAMASARRSLELCRRYGDRSREGDGLSVSGIILLEVGLYEQAAATFSEALEILERTTSRWSRADCLIYAGVCDVRRGHRSGIAMLDEALAEARRIGARYLEANALVTRAGAHLLLGSLQAAVEDASEGTALARTATLVGYEVQGLARHALAVSRSGSRSAEAGALVHRALALLEQQRFLEGSEEEVLAACAEVLDTAGATDRAAIVRERGRASAQRKLEALTDPTWRAAFVAIPEVAALLR